MALTTRGTVEPVPVYETVDICFEGTQFSNFQPRRTRSEDKLYLKSNCCAVLIDQRAWLDVVSTESYCCAARWPWPRLPTRGVGS